MRGQLLCEGVGPSPRRLGGGGYNYSWWQIQWTSGLRQQRRRPAGLVCAADPYVALGLSRGASLRDIKAAYRKKALKLHPDVNKAADAAQRFAEVKAAYQELTENVKRQGAGGGGTGGRQGYGSTSTGGYSSYRAPRQGGGVREDDYSFSQFWSDLTKEMSEWEAAAAVKGTTQRGGGRQGAEKSLWEELSGLGEELVEFLEQGIEEPEQVGPKQQPRGKYDWIDDIGAEPGAGTRTGRTTSGSSAGQSMPPRSSAAGSTAGSNGSASAGGQKKKSKDEEVDDMMAELKKKLGM